MDDRDLIIIVIVGVSCFFAGVNAGIVLITLVRNWKDWKEEYEEYKRKRQKKEA